MKANVPGARGLWASRLLFGTLTMGPLQRNLPIEEGAQLLCYGASRGITTLDTAEYYGTYPYIKEALKTHPHLRVITKSYAYDKDGAKRSLALAQEGLGREYIDGFLLHEQESEHTLCGHREAFDYYLSMKEKGVIGAVGISTHYVAAARAAAKYPGLDILFAMINEKGIGIADGSREDMEKALEQAAERGIAVLAMKALGGGHLIRERERALSYVLSLQYIAAIALGMQSTAEIDYNLALFSGLAPDGECAKASMEAERHLIIQDWCQGCGQCVARCGQKALSIVAGKAVVDGETCVRCGYCAKVCPDFCLKVI